MAEISWTDEAQRWLTDIFEYIAADNPRPPREPSKAFTTERRISKDFPSSVLATLLHSITSGYCFTGTTESRSSSRTTGTLTSSASSTERSTSRGINSNDT